VKKILWLLSILLFGMNFLYGEITPSTNNLIQTQEYQSALKVYQAKKYEKALALFDKLVEKYPQNELVNFYYGRSAFELKNYDFAFTVYDRILITNPQNYRVRLEYARTLFMMKSYKEAKKEFESVLASPIPKIVRKNVEKFLELVNSKEKGYVLNKIAIFGFGWEDNINNSTYEYANNVITGLTNNNTNKKSDTNFKTILVGNLIVPYKTNKHISWESTGVLYLQKLRHYHDNDIFLISLTSGIGYVNQKYKNLASMTYDDVLVGGKHTLYTYGLSDSIKYKIYKKHLLTINIKYKKKKWVQKADTTKNSSIKELSFNYLLPIKNSKDKFNLFTSYKKEQKDAGTRADVNKNTKQYKISYTKNLFDKYNMTLAYQLQRDKYKDALSSTIPPRDDKTKTATIGVTRALSKIKTVTIEYNNIDNKSNNNIYSYKKQSVNLSYTVLF